MVNVVDLMRLQPSSEHPHGMSDADFDALFTVDKPVVFAFHGYPALVHQLTYRRHNHANIHVRGYKELGTTTTPFDMVMLNDLDRFHLVMDVVDRVPQVGVAVARSGTRWRPGAGRPGTTPGRWATTCRRCATGPGRTEPAAAGVRVLVVNAGSSTLKLRVVDEEDAVVARADLPAVERMPPADLAGRVLEALGPFDAVGHRVVHGGREFSSRCGSRARCGTGSRL